MIPRVGRTFGRVAAEYERELRQQLHASLDDGYMLTVKTQLDWGRLPS